MLADISVVAGLLGLIVSTVVLARQTRAAVVQAEISNAAAAVSANQCVMASLREVQQQVLERPSLRPYFYDGVPGPADDPARSEVLMIAEMFADVLSVGLHTHQVVPASGSRELWAEYCRDMLRTSPALVELLRSGPGSWPALYELAGPGRMPR